MIKTPPKPARYVGDLKVKNFSSPKKAARNLELVKTNIEKQRKTIKTLRIQKKRLELRLDSMKDLLAHLRDQKLLSEEASSILSVHLQLNWRRKNA